MKPLARWRADRSRAQDRVENTRATARPDAELKRISILEPSVTSQLQRDGFVHLSGFLSADEVAEAHDVFAQVAARLDRPLGNSWFPTILLPDDELRAFITERLTTIVVPKLNEVMDTSSAEVVRIDFSVKPASPESELGPHQDYSVVDEQSAESLYLWIPLCRTDEHNGTLYVVAGSHRFTNRIRSRHVAAVFDDVLDEVREASVAIECAPGDLVIMMSGVIHFSPPNLSEQLRLAVHGIVKPAEVPLVFYYEDELTPAGKVECYELEIESYVHAIRTGRPGLDQHMSRLDNRPVSSMSPARFAEGMRSYRSICEMDHESGSEENP